MLLTPPDALLGIDQHALGECPLVLVPTQMVLLRSELWLLCVPDFYLHHLLQLCSTDSTLQLVEHVREGSTSSPLVS